MTGDSVMGVQTSTHRSGSSPRAEFIAAGFIAGFIAMDINDIVQAAVEYNRPSLLEPRMVLAVDTCCDLPRIRGNQERLTDVLQALLFRAERSIASAARPSGAITIRTWSADGTVCFRVSDDGLGAGTSEPIIPDLPLTLTQCAEIISDHGGRMYSWRPYGRGASYTIILPAL